MKRFYVLCVCALCATAVFAEGTDAQPKSGKGLDNSNKIFTPSDVYPVRVDVTKIFSCAQGYRVIYRKGATSMAEVYIPAAWFTSGGKAALITGKGREYPYMVVFYDKDGNFSHLKLFAVRSLKDSSWGLIDGDPGDRFNVETIKLEF